MKLYRTGRLGTVIFALAVAGAAVWYFAGTGEAVRTPAGSYIAKAVDTGTVRKVVSASGSVRPLITVEIGSQLSGQIADLLVDYNDEVKEGQLLARIDPQTFKTRVTQARAELAVARAGVDIQKAAVVRTNANLKEAERTLKRQRELRAQGNVSAAALETAETQVETGRAEVAAAEAQLRNAKATVIQREAALEQAQIDLERTEIKSSINGTVIARSVELGQTVAASLQAPTLFQIAQDLSDIQVEASVDEADIGSVVSGNRVEFTVDAFEGRTFLGTVDKVRLAPTEQANVVTYTVVITARNPGRMLLPGMTANVDIVTGERADVLRLSNDALRFRPKGAVQAVASDAGPGSGGPAGGQMREMVEKLGLSADQRAQLQSRMQELRAGMQPPQGGDMDTRDRMAMRDQFRQRMDAVLKDVLTAAQWTKLQAERQERRDVRRAQVYTLAADGSLTQTAVTLGLSDEENSEILSGLSVGAQVVVREERAVK